MQDKLFCNRLHGSASQLLQQVSYYSNFSRIVFRVVFLIVLQVGQETRYFILCIFNDEQCSVDVGPLYEKKELEDHASVLNCL